MTTTNAISRLALTTIIPVMASAAMAQTDRGLCSQPHVRPDTSGHKLTSYSTGGYNGSGPVCALIDFEGLGNQQVIGTVPGDINVVFGPSWLGLIDVDSGGSGNFANEPSPDTIAFFLQPADPIDFDQPVQFVQVSYVAAAVSLPVTLTAWDGPGGTGSIVDVAIGNTLGTSTDGAACSGDPFGDFCLWDILTLTAASDQIRSITLSGAVENQFGFDDMTFCTSDPIAPYGFGVGCPCGNDDPGAGCMNSTGSGALLWASGTPSVVSDNLVLTVSDVPANQYGVIYIGAMQDNAPFGDGLRVVSPGPPGSYVRFSVQNASGAGELVQGPGIAAEYLLLTGSAIHAGETWYFQGFYRDPAGSCGSAFNLSNGLAVTFSL